MPDFIRHNAHYRMMIRGVGWFVYAACLAMALFGIGYAVAYQPSQAHVAATAIIGLCVFSVSVVMTSLRDPGDAHY
jgi:hypothetical protein